MSSPAQPTGRALAPRRLSGLLLAGLITTVGTAQVQVLKPRPPGRAAGVVVLDQNKKKAEGQVGPIVRMPVSLNIDRYLMKAQSFLDQGKFSSAFKLLRDVIDGRTLTDDADDEASTTNEGGADVWDISSAKQAVFSNDDRMFHPVRRLCHELLAGLPPEGILAYRTEFEYAAEGQLREARQSSDVHAIEEVFEQHFVSLSGARALELGGDYRMDRGQFRAALQNYRLLLEVYPENGRELAGVDDAYVRFKIALCYSRLGADAEVARELDDLRRFHPEATLRIMGELVASESLPDHPLFAESARGPRDVRTIAAPATPAAFEPTSEFVPLWEFRFDQPRPYRVIREAKSRGRIVFGGNGSTASAVSLSSTLFVPGTSVTFLGDRIAFLDHFRLRAHETLSGRMQLETAEPLKESLRPSRPRARVPAYDFATSKITRRENLLYAVIGPAKPRDMGALLDNRIVAYDEKTLAEAWTSESNAQTAKLTFLARPTVFGNKLLVPVLDQGTVALQCLDAETGASLYRIAVHRGGTQLARPTASPVVVDQGTAFVLSNAGALAAVDAHTGTLRWIRRYERVHPLRPKKLSRSGNRNNNPWGMQSYSELTRLPGFAPSELFAIEGLIVFAPCDGNVLHCIDGATGEPVWMLNRIQRVPNATHVSRGMYLIGHDGQHLFIGGDADVSCIKLRSGVRMWREELPSIPGSSRWRGRGVVTRDHVLMPGTREILVREIAAPMGTPWKRVPLPELSIGREPLDGGFNLQVEGPYLAACYEGGIEIYSTVDSLLHLASATESPEKRSLLQAQAGDLIAAFATIEAVDIAAIENAERRADLTQRVLSITSELSIAMAAHGARQDALDLLARCRKKLTDKKDLMLWHLARIEVFQALGDLDAVETEQLALYALMES